MFPDGAPPPAAAHLITSTGCWLAAVESGVGIRPRLAYGEAMGRLILILLAAFAALMLVSVVVSAIHFLFWIAVVVLVVLGALRLTGGMRRRARR